MKLERVLRLIYRTPWLVKPEAHEAIQEIITAKLENGGIPFEGEEAPDLVTRFGSLAVLSVSGVLLPKCSNLEKICGAASCEDIRREVKALAKDPSISTVIFNFDSPGGVVTSIPETGRAIAELSKAKRTLSYTSGECCSAAYWLASQTGEILASPSSTVGSIGVYVSVLTMEEKLKNEGVKAEIFQAGRYKTLGIACRDMTNEERAILQAGVDKCYAEFTGTVTAARPQVSSETMQGQVFDGEEALAVGLVDGVEDDIANVIDWVLTEAA